jgi:hypothetical protein
MALRRSKNNPLELITDPEPEIKVPRGGVPGSLIASAMQVKYDDLSYNFSQFPYNGRDLAWQRELWRLYNCIPEFHYAADWVGNCCSQVRIYVAEVDKLGRVQQEVSADGKDAKVAALSDKMFGGPTGKREALRYCGINATVVGEFYILGKRQEDADKWYIISPTQIRRIQGEFYWGDKFTRQLIDLSKEMLTRVWTPHPEWVQYADSPARACQAILRELEQLTKYVFSQIDSRLVGAGLLIIPNNLEMPKADGDAQTFGDSLMMRLATAGAASLRGEGTAQAVLPHIVQSPVDAIEGWKLLQFDSELSKQALELRAEAIRRLGLGLDMPPEALSGMGEANHWAGWFIDGYGIKVHIEPLMNRICGALTTAYLRPALKLMGKDPDRYVFAYDTSPLAIRPQRLQDALNLYEKRIVSAEAVRNAGNFKESDAMSDDENAASEMFEIVLRDPNLLAKESVREIIGIDIPQEEFMLAGPTGGLAGQVPGAGPPPPPPPPTGIQSELPGALPPGGPGEITPPSGAAPGAGAPLGPRTGPTPPGPITAGAGTQVRQDLALVVLAELVVRRAMEVAGKRLLDRHNRDRWPDVPHFDLHTRIRVADRAHAERLLQGAWGHLPGAVDMLDYEVDTGRLQAVLNEYCATLLVHSAPHAPDNLFSVLTRSGFTHGS